MGRKEGTSLWLVDPSGGRVIWKLIVQKPKRTVVHSAPCWGRNNASWTRGHLRTRGTALTESAFHSFVPKESLYDYDCLGFRSETGDVEKERKSIAWLES